MANHTFNHLKGWYTKNQEYYENIQKCQDLMPKNKLFRPPYGRIKPSQYIRLKKEYKIVMWNQLSWDFLTDLNKEKALSRLKKNVKENAVVVFHDSQKSFDNLVYLLPNYLKYLQFKNMISRAL
ncbi:MAG: Uncharacterised protein [Bacteroidetes bacterium MED-G17]|nr:MAG: Uncharacterised protein [Bacteroidetes bacterium MED-G17]